MPFFPSLSASLFEITHIGCLCSFLDCDSQETYLGAHLVTANFLYQRVLTSA